MRLSRVQEWAIGYPHRRLYRLDNHHTQRRNEPRLDVTQKSCGQVSRKKVIDAHKQVAVDADGPCCLLQLNERPIPPDLRYGDLRMVHRYCDFNRKNLDPTLAGSVTETWPALVAGDCATGSQQFGSARLVVDCNV